MVENSNLEKEHKSHTDNCKKGKLTLSRLASTVGIVVGIMGVFAFGFGAAIKWESYVHRLEWIERERTLKDQFAAQRGKLQEALDKCKGAYSRAYRISFQRYLKEYEDDLRSATDAAAHYKAMREEFKDMPEKFEEKRNELTRLVEINARQFIRLVDDWFQQHHARGFFFDGEIKRIRAAIDSGDMEEAIQALELLLKQLPRDKERLKFANEKLLNN